MKILYLDARTSGLAGDMCVAALIDAGAPPEALDAAFAELWLYEQLGWAEPGQGAGFLASAALGGPRPVNPSGGLIAKGHPLAATGLARLLRGQRRLTGRTETKRRGCG